MDLIFDTHAYLWFLEGNERLSKVARVAIEDPETCVFLLGRVINHPFDYVSLQGCSALSNLYWANALIPAAALWHSDGY